MHVIFDGQIVLSFSTFPPVAQCQAWKTFSNNDLTSILTKWYSVIVKKMAMHNTSKSISNVHNTSLSISNVHNTSLSIAKFATGEICQNRNVSGPKKHALVSTHNVGPTVFQSDNYFYIALQHSDLC